MGKIYYFGLNMNSIFSFLGFWALLIFNLTRRRQRAPLMGSYAKLADRLIKSKDPPRFFRSDYMNVTEIFFLSAFQFFLALLFDVLFGIATTHGEANYFGFIYFGPVSFALICLLLRVSPLRQLDQFAPGYIFSLICFKIACFFNGCCYGIPWEYGIYNHVHNQKEVPIQLIETGTALLTLAILLRYGKRNTRAGTLAPLALFVYSLTRFGTEFFRADFPALAGPLTTYHFQCLIGVVLGALEFFAAYRYGNAFSAWIEERNARWEEKTVAGYRSRRQAALDRQEKEKRMRMKTAKNGKRKKKRK